MPTALPTSRAHTAPLLSKHGRPYGRIAFHQDVMAPGFRPCTSKFAAKVPSRAPEQCNQHGEMGPWVHRNRDGLFVRTLTHAAHFGPRFGHGFHAPEPIPLRYQADMSQAGNLLPQRNGSGNDFCEPDYCGSSSRVFAHGGHQTRIRVTHRGFVLRPTTELADMRCADSS